MVFTFLKFLKLFLTPFNILRFFFLIFKTFFKVLGRLCLFIFERKNITVIYIYINIHSSSLVKDICLWMPVMILSRLYSIEIGSLYLNECAKQNKWLKFLVFAQIFQLSKDQVILNYASMKFSFCIKYCRWWQICHTR